jgi:NADH-quinone oxidoreductase subunit J
MALQIIFILVAAVTLGAALMTVTSRNLVHSALWLIMSLFGVAVLYVLLNASFLAVAQVVIYIGAIAILIIFGVMMTRRLAIDTSRQINSTWWLAALLSLVFLGGLSWMLSNWDGFWIEAPVMAVNIDPVKQLGAALVAPNLYVLPFELASVLLLAALIGSIIIAYEKR